MDPRALVVLGVPFDAYGRAGAVSHAPSVLREHGLVPALERVVPVHDYGDLDLPPPNPARAAGSGLINESALLELVERLPRALAAIWRDQRFPLVLGGDCSILLGALPAARDSFGLTGLLFLDGHEDAYDLDRSPDGQAADSELALLLGRGGAGVPPALERRLPALELASLAMLGPRSAPSGVPTLLGEAFLRRDFELKRGSLDAIAEEAMSVVCRNDGRFWLHVDLDILSAADFPAHDFPEPGGVTWPVLTQLTKAALSAEECVGWSVVIYNPDLDPSRQTARRVIEFLVEASSTIA